MSDLNKQVKKNIPAKNFMVHCYRCGAHYSGGGKWAYGVDVARGTEGSNFKMHGLVKEGDCPMCRQPPLLEAPQQVRGM